MRVILASLFSLFAAFASHASEQRPMIMQSLCTPDALDSKFDPFGFELIQTEGAWAARIYPTIGATKPVPILDIPNAKVVFVNSPNAGNEVITLTQTVDMGTTKHTIIALSELVSGNPKPFSVTLYLGRIESSADNGAAIKTTCAFVNEETPYERKSL